MTHRLQDFCRTALPRRGFKRDVAVLLSGSVAGQGLVVVATLFLSRLYSPGDLGLLAVFSALESILVVVTCLRYEQAVAVTTDDDDAANLLGLAVTVALAVTVVVLVVGALFGSSIADALGVPGLENYVVLFAAALIFDALYQAFSFWALRQRHLTVLARTKIAQGAVQAGGQVGLGALGFRPGGLLWGWTAGRMAGTLRLARTVQKDGALSRIRLGGMRRVAGRYRRFPALGAPASLLNSASLQLPGILLAATYGADVAGWFLLATRVTAVPVTIIGQAVSQGFVSKVAEAQRLGKPTRRLVRSTVLVLACTAAVPGAVLIFLGPVLFPMAFGSAWREAGTFVQVLVPAFVVQFAVSPVSWMMIARNRQGVQLLWDGSRLILVALAMLVPAAVGASAVVTLAMYSAVMVVTYGALFAAIIRCAPDRPTSVGPMDPEPIGDLAVVA